MPIRAITIDFWDTMVIAQRNGDIRQRLRLGHLLDVAQAYRTGLSHDDVKAAYEAARSHFNASWVEDHQTPATSALVHRIWDRLDVPASEAEHEAVVATFEEGILEGPPDFTEGLENALAWAAERYRLGVISDTMFSPGRVIRTLLERRSVKHHFDAFIFSDETGFSKPDVRAFERAASELGVGVGELVHVGDLRRTDVTGAQSAGASAVLYTGVHTREEDKTPVPHEVIDHWNELPAALERL